MTKYISLLRGINVSGQKKISMADLKDLYFSLNFTNVSTYIQSGNVIFCSEKKEIDNLCNLIEEKIKEEFNFLVTVIILTESKLKRVILNNPFKADKVDTKKLFFTFLNSSQVSIMPERLKDYETKDERFIIDKDVIYLYLPGGYGKTKFNNNFFERQLKINATTRNWNSVVKLFNKIKEVDCEK